MQEFEEQRKVLRFGWLGLHALSLPIPLEQSHRHLVRRKVDDGEAVLLDRPDLFVHVEMSGR